MNKHNPTKAILIMSLLILSLTVLFHVLPNSYSLDPPKEVNTIEPPKKDSVNIIDKGNTIKKEKSSAWELVNKVSKKIDEICGIFSLITFTLGAIITFALTYFKDELGAFFYNIFIYRRKVNKYKANILANKDYNRIELPFPKCPIKHLNMGDAYINLSLRDTENKNQEQYLPSRQIIEDIKHKYLMIVGSPGSGKSTLCKNVVYQYGNGSIIDKIPFLIELGKNGNITPTSIERFVIEIIKEKLNTNNSDYLIRQKLSKGDFRIIFDSFDEVSTNNISSVNEAICMFIDKYNKCAFIITCRKSVSGNFVKEKCSSSILTFEIEDLRMQDIEIYVTEWKKKYNKIDINAFLLHLEERSKIRELAKEPLMVALSIYLYVLNGSLPYTRTTFYKELSNKLLRLKDNETKKTMIIDSLARIAWQVQQKIDKADNNKANHRITFDNAAKSIDPYSEKKEILDELVISGLLQKTILEGQVYYEFPLKTHREYYTAYYLKELHENTDNRGEDSRFLLIEKFANHFSNYREVVKFYCGMCKEESSVSQLLYELHNFDLGHQSTVALEALSESRIVTNISTKILDYYFNLDSNLWVESDISKKLGSIVSNMTENDEFKKIGEIVFERLKNKLNEIYDKRIEESVYYRNIVLTLAYSFTKQASELLLKHYKENDDDNTIYGALTKMGNISVGHLGIFAEDGDTKAVDCLVKIGTDKAIIELVRIVCSGKENDSISRIAWYFAQTKYIQKINSIYSLLKIYNIEGDIGTINYAWTPFEVHHESITRIMNRIAYLLINATVNTDIINNATIDNRLLIPLQIEITNNRVNLDESIATGYKKYNDSTHVQDNIKKINDVLQNNSYQKSMNFDSWCKEWANIKNSNNNGEYIFSKNELFDFPIPIIGAGIMSFMTLFFENNIVFALFSIFITFVSVIGILLVKSETYSDDKLMNYLGLKSMLELLFFPIILTIYYFSSPMFAYVNNGVGIFFMDFLIFSTIIVLIFVRYEKWNSSSIFSKLIEELNIKNFIFETDKK